MLKLIRRFRDDKAGVTAIEYALIAGVVSVAIVSGATMIGAKANSAIENSGNSLRTE